MQKIKKTRKTEKLSRTIWSKNKKNWKLGKSIIENLEIGYSRVGLALNYMYRRVTDPNDIYSIINNIIFNINHLIYK